MWIATRLGFYSMSNKPAAQFPEYDSVIHVRGRSEEDMQRLVAHLRGLALKINLDISKRENVDYTYRIFVHPSDLPKVLARLADTVDYTSFKGTIGETDHQKHKLNAYCQFWYDMVVAFGEDPMTKG